MSGDSTSTDLVRSTNPSAPICSSTRSKCRMSSARMRTSASASPDTVLASTTSASPAHARRIAAGGVDGRQYSSTYPSTVQPSAAGSRRTVNAVITPSARSRSTRRLTADAESPISAPRSAKLRRESATSSVTIFSSSGSQRTRPSSATMALMHPTDSPVHPLGYRVDSEVGTLRQVLLHRPGLELKRLTPGNKDQLLFDDVLWVQRAQEEHDGFAALLRGRGIEVHLFDRLLRETFELPEAKAYALDRIFDDRMYGPLAV